MKLTALLFFIALMQVTASSYSQVSKLTLDFKDRKLEEIFSDIERMTDYSIFYKNELIEHSSLKSGKYNDRDVFAILDDILQGEDLSYEVKGKLILIVSKEQRVNDTDFAQKQSNIKGKVTDPTGVPLPGVTIVVKGTTQGTITDRDGNYSLSNVPGDATLVFSFVGMRAQQVPVAGKTTINVVMEEETVGIEEVVAVGYGTQKKVNLTGALSSVGSEEIKSISTSNMVTGLAGKLPGMNITQRTGEPGSYTTYFDVRGFGTPLIIIDGIARGTGDFSRLDPHDIESITILKDASAAVYGVKAAHGVVLVTTKKGDLGKPKVIYTGGYEWQQIANQPKVGNAYEFALLTTENEINGGKAPGSTTYSAEDLQKFKDGTYPSTDWFHVIARDYTTLKRHNLNISGGSEKIKYFTSVGYLDEMGLWKSGDLNYKKYNLRSSVTGDITKNLNIQLNIDAMLENKNEPGEPAWNILKFTWMNIPTYTVYANNNPEYLQNMTYAQHPLAMSTASLGGYTKTKSRTFQSNAVINYKFPFIDGLSAKFTYSFLFRDQFIKSWRKKYMVYDYDKTKDVYIAKNSMNNPSNLTGNYTPAESNTLQAQLNYEKSINKKHNFKTALVFEQIHSQNDNMSARKEFAIDVDQFFAGVSQNATVSSGGIYEEATQSVIGRLNYDYLSRYLFEFGFNYNGSSKFAKGHRWGFFPYTSAGWRISEESFIKNNFPIISNLKIRGSWGQMGDDAASTYQFLTGYNYPSGNYVFDGKVIPGLGFRGMPNPNITWFTIITKNLGLDIDIKNGLLTVQADIFRQERTGLLTTRLLTIPGTVGAALPQENLNEDFRRGFELVLGHAKRTGEFKYDISANVTFTRPRATRLEQNPYANSYLNWRNNTLNRWGQIAWGYNYIGQFQTMDEVLSSPIQDGQGNRTLRPGDLKYEDVNKDGIISGLDQVPIGRNSVPCVNYGLNMNASWKHFDLNVFFHGAAGFNFQYIEQMKAPLTWGRNSLSQFMDRWHHEDIYDVTSPWIPGKFPATGYPASNSWDSQFWWVDASYLRLKSVELGYTFDQNALHKAGIQNVRLFVSGFNLLTWTKVKYMDPEQDPSQYNYLYPLTKNYNIGVNITF
ncbi:MAG: SusC/RagA family TonB-linked outer membrane protein [Mangrovibacterium sp.]